jgi:hypothetical protein
MSEIQAKKRLKIDLVVFGEIYYNNNNKKRDGDYDK